MGTFLISRTLTTCGQSMVRSICVSTLVLLLVCVGAHAQVYKCTDADGSSVYTQMPCSDEQSADSKAASPSVAPLDCSHATRFAAWTARLMRGGARSDEVFNRYGGLNSLSKGSIGVINYVYSFRSNDDVTVERIAGLAEAKCKSKSFGSASCEALPPTFTDGIGSCDPEKEADAMFGAGSGEFPLDTTSTNSRATEARRAPATNRAASSRSAKDTQQCKKPIRDKIDVIDAKMRRGYSSEQGEIYRQQLRVLTQELRKCE